MKIYDTQLKEQVLVSDQVNDFLLADLNKDGKQDLLLASAALGGRLKAYEIPYSIDFKWEFLVHSFNLNVFQVGQIRKIRCFLR